MASSHPNHEFDDELLSAYVDDELTAEQRSAVEERLRTDEQARQLVAQLRAASEAVKALPRASLGRDLRSSVLAAIEGMAPEAELPADQPTILAMSESESRRRPRGARPLIWAAFAVAAALLLMAVRSPDRPAEDRQVAVNSSEKKLEADKPADGANSISADNRGNGGAEAGRADGVARSVISPKIVDEGNARQISGFAANQEPVPGATPTPAEAAPPMAAAEQPTMLTDSRGAYEDVTKAALDVASRTLDLQGAYEFTIADESGLAQFERLLAAHQIVLSKGELPDDLKGKLTPALAEQLAERRDAGDRAAAKAENAASAPVEAVLVEASAAEIASLVAAMRADSAAFADMQRMDRAALAGAVATGATSESESAATAGLARGGGIGGGGGGFGGGRGGVGSDGRGGREMADRQTIRSRAWRFSIEPLQLEAKLATRGVTARPQGAAAPVASAPAAPASGEPEAASRARASGGEPVRALFLLRRGAK